MTGVIEGAVIGGAAWGALEHYKEIQDRKKEQKR